VAGEEEFVDAECVVFLDPVGDFGVVAHQSEVRAAGYQADEALEYRDRGPS
jgi:hypothetical protein